MNEGPSRIGQALELAPAELLAQPPGPLPEGSLASPVLSQSGHNYKSALDRRNIQT